MSYEKYAMEILEKLGVDCSHKGCAYILSSIHFIHIKEKNFCHVTKNLYTEIAREHKISELGVEREIRKVVKAIWEKNENEELKSRIFGSYNLAKRPGNMEFLVLLYNHIKYNSNYKNWPA